MIKPRQQKINGILLLDKPLTLSSNAALQRVKRLFQAEKAGHTGSLDPLATGMLPICFGEATKFSQFLLESDKCYQITAQLGVKTTTGDAEGEVITTRPVGELTREHLAAVINEFIGSIQQIPPMYSAIKHQGKPLYKLARQGLEVAREPRTVRIYSAVLGDIASDHFEFEVHCSKGTYIRTLVEDIGERLGCGAYVSCLRRVSVAPYQQGPMYTLAELEARFAQGGCVALYEHLLPVETSVQSLPHVRLADSVAFYLKLGQPVMTPQLPAQGLVRLFSAANEFMGVGEILEDGRVAPKRLVNYPLSQGLPPATIAGLKETTSQYSEL